MTSWPPIGELPVPEVIELEGKEAFNVLVDQFDWLDEATMPIGLDLVPTEEELERERLRRAGLLPEVKPYNDIWGGR